MKPKFAPGDLIFPVADETIFFERKVIKCDETHVYYAFRKKGSKDTTWYTGGEYGGVCGLSDSFKLDPKYAILKCLKEILDEF